MRIGIFGDQRFLHDGKGNYYTKGNLRKVLLYEYAKHFDKVYLFFRTKQDDISWAPPEDIIRHEKIEFINLPTFEGLLGVCLHKKQIKTIVEENIDKCDIYVLRFCYRLSCLAAPIANKMNKPTIAHLRGDIYSTLMYDIERIPVKLARWILASINWRRNYRVVNTCDRIVGTSRALAQLYAHGNRDALGIADGCTNEEFFIPARERPATEPANIIVVARINYAKNVQQLIFALAKVLERGGHCRLTVVGDGPYLNKLRKFCAELGLQKHVDFTGRVDSRGKLVELFRQAHIGALTSRTEGMPSSVLESMAASLPVVSSDLPCIREIVKQGENGYIVPLDDADSCSDRILELVTNEPLRLKMGKAAHETALSYRTDRQVEKLVALCRELNTLGLSQRRK